MRGRDISMLGLAALFGFLGGWVSGPVAKTSAHATQTVRAERFELVDKSGRSIALLGEDSDKRTVLAFAQGGIEEVAAIGLGSGNAPFLELRGPDGKVRAVLQLEKGSLPVLAFSDAQYEGRVVLGPASSDYPSSLNDSWALSFRAPWHREPAAIGMFGEKDKLSGVVSVTKGSGETWSAP
jgi:hypothetical protein